MRSSISALVLVCCAAATAAEPVTSPRGDDENAVLAVVDRFMTAVSSNDVEALEAIYLPEAVTHRIELGPDGAEELTVRSASYWRDPANRRPAEVNERYWAPTVHLRGPIAVVWTPYEFKRGGATSHCGIDVFNLVRSGGEWRIASAMWTVEPEACAELRPADPAAIRPRE